jgi:hypothetical protein
MRNATVIILLAVVGLYLFSRSQACRESAEITHDYGKTVRGASEHVGSPLKICSNLQRLREALTEYMGRNGFYPPTLEALVGDGFISRIPADPTERGYDYDPTTGQVTHPACSER